MTTSFAHVTYPTEHAGVVRFERAAEALGSIRRSFDGARGAAALLLAAITSALLVVANQVVETWTDGHLLAAWIVLWTVAFAALALLAQPARAIVTSVRSRFARQAAVFRQRREDDKLWRVALADARVMADLSRAMSDQAVAHDVRRYL
jgi:hypothetical protein